MARLNYTGAQLDEAISKVRGSYADVSGVDLTAAQARAGKKFVTAAKVLTTGTMPNAVITPNVAVSGGVIGETVSDYPVVITPKATVGTAGYVDSVADGASVTRYIQAETKTATPTTAEQTITPSNGKLLSGVIVEGDSDLAAANIKKDVVIFGVTGTYEAAGGDMQTRLVRVNKISYAGTPDASAPTITAQPQSASYTAGGTATALSVTVTRPDGGALSYRWQKSIDGSETYNNITGATSSTYTPDISVVSTNIYRCVVTNTVNGTIATATSNAATVTVTASEQITDLTGTKWYIGNVYDIWYNEGFPPYIDQVTTSWWIYNINFIYNGVNYTLLKFSTSASTPCIYEIIFGNTVVGSYDEDLQSFEGVNGEITITGGTDATNATLISWLSAYATQV